MMNPPIDMDREMIRYMRFDDDAALMSESDNGLQNLLTVFTKACIINVIKYRNNGGD